MKQRITYIDSAKALLIALVVLGHILQYANPRYDILPYTLMQEFISSFHMPAFFLLSGMLSDAEKWRKRSFADLLKSRCLTLLVPYCFFEFLAILYKHFILHAVSLKQGLYLMVTLRCNIGADWFLPALFLANLFYWIYVRCPGRWKWIPALAVGFAVPCILPDGHGWNLLFRGLLGFGFMVAGVQWKDKLEAFSVRKCAVSFLITAASAAIALKFSLGNDFYSCSLRCPPLFLIIGVCGLYVILCLARLVDRKWLMCIGNQTLVIMGTHQLVLYTLPAASGIGWICGTFALIAVVEVAVCFITNRLCPVLIGKGRKERANV